MAAYGDHPLPQGIRCRFVNGVNGLAMHILEAGFEVEGRPCVLLLHGFPELAYSWRKVMLPLAAAGFHVVAPDQRGCAHTTGWVANYDGDLGSFRIINVVRDALWLVAALGYRSVAAVIGHDFGSPVAAFCALIRPDVFRSVVLISAPFSGPPSVPFGAASDVEPSAGPSLLFDAAIYDELAKLPTYYVMDLNHGMAETVAPEAPSAADIAACKWLTEDELEMYSGEFERTGFQGGLQWYRCATTAEFNAELEIFSGCTIDVPSCFIAEECDWGVYQIPGALEKMRSRVCTQMLGGHLVEGAGHWVQQEQPEEVSRLLLAFLSKQAEARL